MALEAMYAARPSSSRGTAAGRREFIADGENGFVVEPEARRCRAARELYRDRALARRWARAAARSFRFKPVVAERGRASNLGRVVSFSVRADG